MDAVFERVLELSFSGGIIALVALFLRPLLKSAPKRVLCLLWMIVVLRLLVPFEIQSNWSLQPDPVIPAPTTQPHTGGFDTSPAPETVPQSFPDNAVTFPVTTPPAEETPESVNLLPTLWLLGVAILGVHGCVSFLRLKRRVRHAIIFEEGVWLCPGLDTAFVLGFFRPQIYLPILTGEEQELVLRHERCHLRRLDHWWKLAAYCAVCVHWFNPMAWVTYVLLCRDMEMACDQETVKNMTNAQRRAYSAALLRCAAKQSSIAVCPVAFGEISVKARIKTVLNYKKPAFWVTIIALIAALAVGIFFLTEPADDPVQTLYEELDKLQSSTDVHLQIDMTIDSNYDGWDTCNQEYLKSGGDWYRNFNYTTSAAGYTTSFVHRSGITYAREQYEDGTIPERKWERLNREMDSSLPLLTRNWRVLDVYAVQTEPDGSAVITLLGDLTPTEDTVYEEKAYEFHLTPEGKLDYMVTNSTYTKDISDANAQGTFQFQERDMIRFLDTSPDQISARINTIAEEATAAIHSDDVHQILAELELIEEELRLAEKCYNAYSELLTAQNLHMITSIHSSAYEGEVLSEESFYSGEDYCFQRCSWYSDVPVAVQAVMVDGNLYSSTLQGTYRTGWQPQTLTNEYDYHPRQTLDNWDISGLLRAEEQDDWILLTFAGEPGTYADTDYYTVNGYTVRFRFEGDTLSEVTWEYDLTEDGVRGTDHRIETHTFPATDPAVIRENIEQMHAESQSPCTFSLEEVMATTAESWHVLQQGFQNTTPSPIKTRSDALRIAAQELTQLFHTAAVFYDPDTEVWMVVFSLTDDGNFEVYLNTDGTTRMTIQLRRGEYREFLNHTCQNPAHNHIIPIG